MTTIDYDIQPMIGRRLVDRHQSKIGTISDVYVDDHTGQPTWLTVNTGLFGTKVHFVPLALAESDGDDIIVGYDKDLVKEAPSIEPDGVLDPADEAELYAHYGFPRAGGNRDVPPRRRRGDSSGPETDEAMTRSEEQLDVSTRTRQAGTARLRKWIETEDVEIRVPVRREKARIVTEPVTGSNRDQAMAGDDLTIGEHEVVLNEEVVDVDKRVVPRERVRLETETETDEVAVDDTLRKERIDFEHSDVDRRRTGR